MHEPDPSEKRDRLEVRPTGREEMKLRAGSPSHEVEEGEEKGESPSPRPSPREAGRGREVSAGCVDRVGIRRFAGSALASGWLRSTVRWSWKSVPQGAV